MQKIIAFLATGLAIWLVFSISTKSPNKLEDEVTYSGARQTLDFMSAVRAYPNREIPDYGVALAFDLVQKRLNKTKLATQDLDSWKAIGPHNIGGRTLDIELNPMNPSTIYAGSASGGLWRTRCDSVGPNAWENIQTGFPVRAVSSIAIAPNDSNTIYIGTGEAYGSPESQPGILGERLTRGSYGIGVLKTNDGGLTWEKSLDWYLFQGRAVQMVKINPQNSGTVWAATTEGTYKTVDGGATWTKVHNVVMATDIAINPVDTNTVFIACGGMQSPGHGLYRTQDGGVTWEKMNLRGESFTFKGKMRLGMAPSQPDIVYASIGVENGAIFTNDPRAHWLVKTTDSGESWSTVSSVNVSGIQGWYAHHVAVNPTNPEEIWAAGQSFVPWFSTNGGVTLIPARNLGMFNSDPVNNQFQISGTHADFHDIVYQPDNPQIIYFANDGGVFRTSNGGKTIINCNIGYQTTQFYNGVTSSFSDSLMTIGGLQDNNSAIYEGDKTWRRLFAGDGSWTAIDQSNNNTIYASYQFLNIGKFSNRGLIDNFAEDISPPIDAAQTNFIAPFVLSPVDNKTLYAGSNVILKSVNSGGSWTTTNGGSSLDGNPAVAMAASEQSVNVVYVTTSATISLTKERGNVYKTVNGGSTWSQITSGLPDRFLTDISLNANDDDIVYVTLGGFGSSHLFKSENGGTTWIDIGAGLPDVPTWAVIVDPQFPQHIFVGNDIGVYLSTDGGEFWEPHMKGLPDAIIAMDLSISRANHMLRVATHGNGFYESKLPIQPVTGIADNNGPRPQKFVLRQNYPNPFNPETRIDYFLHEDSEVSLQIYNVRGQRVKTLIQDRGARGTHSVVWDGRNETGGIVASGVYYYKLTVGDQVLSKKMLFVK